MLIFAQIESAPPCYASISFRWEKNTMDDLNMLLNTFTDYRFEVDQCIDMTCSQLENKCQEFFQRDFSQYGAVVVAVLTFAGRTSELMAYDGPFSETIILRHLTSDLNPTLLAKPKIYITEAYRDMILGGPISSPIEEYQDILGLHLAIIMCDGPNTRVPRPLAILCDNINNMADSDDLVTILQKTIKDYLTNKYCIPEMVTVMSWFETVKNVAKIVANSVVEISGGPSVVSAVPDTHRGLWSVLSKSSTSANAAHDFSEESGSGNASGFTVVTGQVTTRARFTFELDRYQKNVLLMFVQMRSESLTGSRVEETTTQDINLLLDTLTGFRFEINTNIDLTCSEIESKCQEFFQQDFNQYGAVIVVVLTFEGVTGQLSALDGRFSESIILRHFTDNLNPTLVAKPKIYITEANRIISSENGPRLSIALEDHQDVLGLHLPTIEHQAMVRRPISLLCHNIRQMADTQDFVTILKKSVEEIETGAQSIFQDKPIELSINFTKEMMLAKS